MTGLVTEVKRKSPSMVHRWVASSSSSAGAKADEVREVQPADREPQIEEQPAKDFSAAGLRSTIKSKLHLNEWYEKISRTRDITGLFQRNATTSKRMADQKDMEMHEESSDEGELEGRVEEDEEEGCDVDDSDLLKENVSDEDVDRDQGREQEEVEKDTYCDRFSESQIEGGGANHKRLGNASSPKHSHDEECQFSFEDFSFIETGKKTPARENALMPTIASQCKDEQDHEDSGVVVGGEEIKAPATKPRRLNIGEIGRSASASHHPDSGIDLGTMGGGGGGGVGGSGTGVATKRHLLSDIGRRFSEMNESSDCCEFRSDSLRKDASLSQFRPNSMPVSPKPRMILPAQHRGSTDFTGGIGAIVEGRKQRGNSLFREYSTQVSGGVMSGKESFYQAHALLV